MLPGEDGEAQLGFGEKKGASDVVTEVHSVLVERLTAQLLTRIYEKESFSGLVKVSRPAYGRI